MATEIQYHQIASNIHLFLHPQNKFKTEYGITFTSGGAYFEKEGEKGVSHLMEHCNVARTKDKDFSELRNFLFRKNIYRNASTSRLYMNFIVSGHKDDSEAMFDLISEFAFDPFYTPEVLEQEKPIVLRETEQRFGDPRYRLYRDVLENALESDSFFLYDVLGNIEDVKNATIETFQTVRKRMMSQSHIVITASGRGINEETIKNKVLSYATHSDPSLLLPIDFLPKNRLKQFKYIPIVNKIAHDHAILNILIPFPVNLEIKHLEVYFENLIFDNTAGVLYDILRNKKGLIYSLNSDLDMAGQMLTIDMTCEIGNVQQIVDEVRKVFTDFNLAFSEERVNTIRELSVKKEELSEDNPNTSMNYMTDNFMDYAVITTLKEHVEQVKNTTLKDIQTFFDEVKIGIDQMRIIVVSNDEKIIKLF